jgi:hypothetical protein
MLVEQGDRNKVVACLLCKTPIKVGTPASPGPVRSSRPTPPPQM